MKKKCWPVIASFSLAVMALLCLVATPALADTTYTPIGGNTTFNKYLVINNDASVPDITFTYTITRTDGVSGVAGAVDLLHSPETASVGTAVFSNTDTPSVTLGVPSDAQGTPTSGKQYATKQVAVTFPLGSFTKPGVYRYIIHEAATPKPGVTYDSNNTRYLDVFITSDTNNVLSATYVLRKTESSISSSTMQYDSNPDEKSTGYTNTITQYNLEFKKAIGGNQGDKNKRFTFTLNITNALPGTYPIETTDVNIGDSGAPASITVLSDGTCTREFSLTDNSSLRVVGLNQGASCTVSENKQDYTATYSVDGAAAVNGHSYTTSMNANHTIVFTNNLNGTIPTGVIVTVAPFAIGIVLFTAGIVYVTARRRRNEFA